MSVAQDLELISSLDQARNYVVVFRGEVDLDRPGKPKEQFGPQSACEVLSEGGTNTETDLFVLRRHRADWVARQGVEVPGLKDVPEFDSRYYVASVIQLLRPIHLSDVGAPEEDAPGCQVCETQHKIGQGRFTAAAFTRNSYDLGRLFWNCQVEVLQSNNLTAPLQKATAEDFSRVSDVEQVLDHRFISHFLVA